VINYSAAKNINQNSWSNSVCNSFLPNESANLICVIVNDSTQIPLLIKPQYRVDSSSSAPENIPVSEQNYYSVNVFEKEKTKQAYVDDTQAQRHLNKIYSLHTSDAEILGHAFEVIESAFARHDLLLVDTLLANFEPNRTKTIVSTGLLRATFRARTKLNSWKLCAAHVSECLNSRGENTKHILRGLIRADDSITITKTTLS
jgi:hypothetical protein